MPHLDKVRWEVDVTIGYPAEMNMPIVNHRIEAELRSIDKLLDDSVAAPGVLQRILPFDDRQAQEAARLYNATGRKRRLRIDAMIAAAATTHRIPLATGNRDDFAEFVPLGLALAQS